MKPLFIAFAALMLTSLTARSQSFLNDTKEQVHKRLYLDKKINIEVINTDSTITFRVNDPKFKKSDRVFHFNKDGKCDSEAIIDECDECYQYELNNIIKHSKWVKADSTHYITRYGKKLEIVTHYQGLPYAFTIKPVDEAKYIAYINNLTASDRHQIFTAVEIYPEFKTGEKGWQDYLSANLTYPSKIKQSGTRGPVKITFVVERDGSITHVDILKGLCEECEAEVLRVIKASPPWKPGITGSKPVRYQHTVVVEYNP